jgi:Arc/MetJ family transcription regulator
MTEITPGFRGETPDEIFFQKRIMPFEFILIPANGQGSAKEDKLREDSRPGCHGQRASRRLGNVMVVVPAEPFSNYFGLEGFLKRARLESMKTTIDIPENSLADAMRFTGAKTKRDAVVMAIEDFNRRRKVADFLKLAGSFPDFPTNDEIEAADPERNARLHAKWKRAR